jgi:hypothetical protein
MYLLKEGGVDDYRLGGKGLDYIRVRKQAGELRLARSCVV